MNDGVSRCPHGHAVKTLPNPSRPGWVMDVPDKERCPLCPEDKVIETYVRHPYPHETECTAGLT